MVVEKRIRRARGRVTTDSGVEEVCEALDGGLLQDEVEYRDARGVLLGSRPRGLEQFARCLRYLLGSCELPIICLEAGGHWVRLWVASVGVVAPDADRRHVEMVVAVCHRDGVASGMFYWEPSQLVGTETVLELLRSYDLVLGDCNDSRWHDAVELERRYVELSDPDALGTRFLVDRRSRAVVGLDDLFNGAKTSSCTHLTALLSPESISCDGEVALADQLSEYDAKTGVAIDLFAYWIPFVRINQNTRMTMWSKRYRVGIQEGLVGYRTAGIPTTTFLPVMLTYRHRRVLISVRDLLPHGYRAKTALSSLKLSEPLRRLIGTLVSSGTRVFNDVVDGKSQADNILLVGPPGVGKTLVCEKLSEAWRSPLYTVPASQLGVDSRALAERLLVIESRARRWGAAVLLDDADVYVRARGVDLQQNAIVDEMLRFMERSNLRVFITSNIIDIDDAVASRCYAKLRLPPPTREQRIEIWKQLAGVNNMKFSIATVRRACSKYAFTGREIYQLLKLLARTGGGKVRYSDQDVEELVGFVTDQLMDESPTGGE